MSRILKVLYVEDDSDDAQILKNMLQVVDPTGFHLSVCRTQRQAIMQLQQEPYDVVFVDYWLRQTDRSSSEQLIRYMIEHSNYLPIVVLTTETRLVDGETMERVRSGRIRLLSKADLSLVDLQELVLSIRDTSYSVLFFDDDPDDHMLYLGYLEQIERCQFRVENAYTETQAAQALARSRFDIMLLDWRIGARDSRELIRDCVQRNPYGCIALITGSSFSDIPEEVIDMVNRRHLAYLCKRHMDAATFEETIMTQLYRTHLSPTENALVPSR